MLPTNKPDTINGKRNNCVLVALREVSNLSDEVILAAVRKCGYKENQGMYSHQYLKAAEILGISVEASKYAWDLFPANGDGSRFFSPSKCSLSKVLPQIADGVYLVRVNGHLLVSRFGRLVDHNYSRQAGLGRRVIDVMRVNNPFVKKVEGFVSCVRNNPRQFGTGAHERYAEMRRWLALYPKTTKEVLLEKTSYRKEDYAWDLRRGNIVIV